VTADNGAIAISPREPSFDSSISRTASRAWAIIVRFTSASSESASVSVSPSTSPLIDRNSLSA